MNAKWLHSSMARRLFLTRLGVGVGAVSAAAVSSPAGNGAGHGGKSHGVLPVTRKTTGTIPFPACTDFFLTLLRRRAWVGRCNSPATIL